MLPQLPEKNGAVPRDRLLWAVAAALCLGQLVAFWMLCSHQVRKARMRDVTSQVQSVAIADCLQYLPRATLNSCANRVDPDRPHGNAVLEAGDKPAAAPGGARATMSSGAPVSAAYR